MGAARPCLCSATSAFSTTAYWLHRPAVATATTATARAATTSTATAIAPTPVLTIALASSTITFTPIPYSATSCEPFALTAVHLPPDK